MRIVELTASAVRIPLRRPIRHASHSRTSTDNLLVRCTLENGVVGYGEGVPRDYVTGETIDADLDILQRSDLAAQLEPCRDYKAVADLCERLRLAELPGDERACGANAARCALELALLDAYGKHFGEALSTITRLTAPELFKPRPWVRYSGAITSANGWKLRVVCLLYRIYGFQQMKVKVGIAGQDDAARLKRIRRLLGRKVELRIDANEAWTPTNAAERIAELEAFGLASVEQPMPHEYLDAYAELRKHIRTPIMLDESLCSRIDAERAVALNAATRFNLRLSKCGGFLATLRLLQFAAKHGIDCQLGCQVGETAILSAAGRHFAAGVPTLTAVEGSFDRHLVREALGKRDITFGRGGWARALVGGGLGIEIEPRRLKAVTLREVTLYAAS